MNMTEEMETIYELGELMSEISEQNYCATWMVETLEVCKEIYSGTLSSGQAWYFTEKQKDKLVYLKNKLGFWVTLNPVDDYPEYIKPEYIKVEE